jgi:hypothetical protein
MAKPSKNAVRITCSVCSERILNDWGSNKVAWHVKKGSIIKCPGVGKPPK